MKLFLDANVLISVLNHELPVFTYSSRVLSLPNYNAKYKLYTSPLCLAITYYFASKKCGNKRALEKMKILGEQLSICAITAEEVIATTNNKKVKDYEDGLQYYAAISAGCDTIITENVKDFYFAEIGVYDCRDFILNVLN
jgi:predicted nucleic acid-binding protein